jgi:hypothetical protein
MNQPSRENCLLPAPQRTAKALQPGWGIIALRQVTGQHFALKEKKPDHWYLPKMATTSIADWPRTTPATLSKKKSNNKASATNQS